MALTRKQILAEMGITPIWRLRAPVDSTTAPAALPDAAAPGRPVAEAVASEELLVPGQAGQEGAACPTAMEPASGGEAGIAGLGRPDGQGGAPLSDPLIGGGDVPGPNDEGRATQSESAPLPPSSRAEAIAGLDWPELQASCADCRACGLGEQRRQAVVGVGDPEADWLFIGEGPGAEEDARGEPFVGQAGKLLDAMLAAIGLKRGQGVYIANAVKCRPPGNRTPTAQEMAACRPYLVRQIELVKPKAIVLLGKAAVSTILHDDHPLGSLRGRRFDYQGIPVAVTYHPAYLLRNLPEKAKAWEDLLFARRLMRESSGTPPEPQPDLNHP